MQTITITATAAFDTWTVTEEERALAASAPQEVPDEDLDALLAHATAAWDLCTA